MSIESIIASSAMFLILFLIIAVFSYLAPIAVMENRVSLLGYLSRIQGGLTAENINNFKDEISSNHSYIEKNNLTEEIVVEVVSSPSEIDLSDIDISEESDEYITKKSGEVIVIKVKIPSNQFLFSGVLGYFSLPILEDYHFTQVVSSERN